MVTGEAIQQGHDCDVGCGVHHLIHSRQWIVIFWRCFVEISEIDAHAPFAVLFLDRHRVGQPFGVHDFADDGGVKQPLDL
jgi:hypothetical protein